MKGELQLVLNINTGTVIPRTPATDENPIIFRRIDIETGRAINTGKVKASEIIEALEKRERNSPDFNWREYDKKRRSAEKLLNVSRRDMVPVADENGETTKDDNGAEVISMNDLLPNAGGKKKASKAQDKDNFHPGSENDAKE